jgi:hypothetical protein
MTHLHQSLVVHAVEDLLGPVRAAVVNDDDLHWARVVGLEHPTERIRDRGFFVEHRHQDRQLHEEAKLSARSGRQGPG